MAFDFQTLKTTNPALFPRVYATLTFSGGSPTRSAIAYAIVTSGVITSVNIVDGGAGYGSVPSISIGGSGTGASLTAVLTSGVVTSINIGTGGSGYITGAPAWKLNFAGNPWDALMDQLQSIGTPSGIVYPELAPYNAVGDGVTDDSAALAAAFNGSSGHVLWLSKNYAVHNLCQWTASNVTVDGPGTILIKAKQGFTFTVTGAPTSTLNATGIGAIYSNGDTVNVSNSGGALPTGLSTGVLYYIVNVGTNSFGLATSLGGTPISVTSNGTGTQTVAGAAYINPTGTAGATTTTATNLPLANRYSQYVKTINVVSATGISVGTTLVLNYNDGTYLYYQICVVQSISGVAVTMTSPILIPLLTTQTGNIQILTPIKNITVKNISIDGSGSSATASIAYGFSASYMQECAFENLRFTGFNQVPNLSTGLTSNYGRDNSYRDLSFINCGSGGTAAFECFGETNSLLDGIRSYGDGGTTQDAFGIALLCCVSLFGGNFVTEGFAGRGFKMSECCYCQFDSIQTGGSTNKAQIAIFAGNYRNTLRNMTAIESTTSISNALGFVMFGLENAWNIFDGIICFSNASGDFTISDGLGGASGANHDNVFKNIHAATITVGAGGNQNNTCEIASYTTLTLTCDTTNRFRIKGGARSWAWNSTGQSIADNTSVALTFDTNHSDDVAGLHSTSVNTSRFTALVPGSYDFIYQAAFASNSNGFRQIKLRQNGSTDLAFSPAVFPAFSGSNCFVAQRVPLNAGDYVEGFAGVFGVGSSLSTSAGQNQTSMNVRLVSD